jgi:hypothetical protein
MDNLDHMLIGNAIGKEFARQALERTEHLREEARLIALLRQPRASWRSRAARFLLAAAQRLEPETIEVRLETRLRSDSI